MARNKLHENIEYYIGKTVDKLIIIEEVPDLKPRSVLCVCTCGVSEPRILPVSYVLYNGGVGCYKCPKTTRLKYKNVGEVPGAYYNLIKHGAKVRDIGFDISMEYLDKLWRNQCGKCALSGLPIKFGRKITDRKEFTASLDRINNDKIYMEGNVQWVHKDINRMKSKYSQDYFISMCSAVVNNIGIGK